MRPSNTSLCRFAAGFIALAVGPPAAKSDVTGKKHVLSLRTLDTARSLDTHSLVSGNDTNVVAVERSFEDGGTKCRVCW
jgi:hypothetical protein